MFSFSEVLILHHSIQLFNDFDVLEILHALKPPSEDIIRPHKQISQSGLCLLTQELPLAFKSSHAETPR